MRHENCDNWDYSTHPGAPTVQAYCKQFLDELQADPASKADALQDTRRYHQAMFQKVTPPACPHLAGNYRGAPLAHLQDCRIYFGTQEGSPPPAVPVAMDFFHADLDEALRALDRQFAATTSPLSASARLVLVAQLVAAALVRFLTVHPYMNGNGHMARMLVWVALTRFNVWPVKWSLHASPPGYAELIDAYRRGHKPPLERFILRCVKG